MEQENRSCGCHSNVDISNISTFSACRPDSHSQFIGAGEEPRTADAKMDFIYPPVVFPTNKIYKTLGEDGIRKMVAHHHGLLRKTSVGHMFEQEEEAFKIATEKTADFFIEALGGGDIFSSKHGHPALRGRHFRFTIDEAGRDIWLAMYKKTLKDIVFPQELIEEFWGWIEPLSIRMINRRTTVDAPKRYLYSEIASEFQS
jgi:hemoglobin